MRKLQQRQIPLYQEYKKQYYRITSAIRELRKEGYQVDYELEKPSEKKSFTKRQNEQLQKVTRQALRERAAKVDYETGEYVEPKTKRRIGGLQKKLPQTQEIFDIPEGDYDMANERITTLRTLYDENLDRLYDDCAKFPRSAGARRIEEWLDSAVSAYGRDVVAQVATYMYDAGSMIGISANPSDSAEMLVFLNNMIKEFKRILEENGSQPIDSQAKEHFDSLSSDEAVEALEKEIEEMELWERARKRRRRRTI